MPLEPWEIELKKQLSGEEGGYRPPQPPVQAPPQPPLPVKPEQKKTDSGTVSFVLTLLFLLFITAFVYDHKTGGKVREQLMSFFKSRPEEEKPRPRPERPATEKKEDTQSEIDKLRQEQKAKLDEMAAKVARNTDKIKALGLVVNENFNIIGQNIPDDFIFLNRDWTLDRSPKYLELTPEDKEYLKKYVRE